ncbi:response regulator transcription factor [Halobacillus sp. H74]|uniref:response regulator transcription factor n=1 Tax=Halobacillus sp. H74 TaxID=3457436 RepID=UPI003FCDC55D
MKVLNIMIVDDEKQIRNGLRMKIDEQKLELSIVEEASNGREALKKLNEIPIDILITDVKMPGMDGVELVKKCKEMNFKGKMLVLSGYSDYEYVRHTMKEGVKDYLLKPVDPEELEEVLIKLRSEIEEDIRLTREKKDLRSLVSSQLQEVKEKYLLHLVKEDWFDQEAKGHRLRQLKMEELTEEHAKFQFVAIEIRGKGNREDLIDQLWLPFRMMCREIAEKYDNVYFFYDQNYTRMAHFLFQLQHDDKEEVYEVIHEVQHYTNEYLRLGTVVGIGALIEGLGELKNGFISSIMSWSQSQINSYSQVVDGSGRQNLIEFPPQVERRLINAVEQLDYKTFHENVVNILNGDDGSIFTFSFASNRILLLLQSFITKYGIESRRIQSLFWECQQNIWNMTSYKKVLAKLLELATKIMEYIKDTRISNGQSIIESVQRYIHQHYSDDISLTDVADLFHMNSSYLSDLFKRHTGNNFSDYVTRTRMEKAKEFLKDPHLKVTEVAFMVGFSNSGYFSTVFKKYYEQSPLEFRKSYGT